MLSVTPEILELLEEFPAGTKIEKREVEAGVEWMTWRLSYGAFAVYAKTLAGLFDAASKAIVQMGVHAATEKVQV